MSRDFLDLEDCSLTELKNIAKEKGLKGCSTLRKNELIEKLEAVQDDNGQAEETKQEESEIKEEENYKNTDDYDERESQNSPVTGVLEVMQDGYGFLRCQNYTSGSEDVYVAHTQIKRFGLRTGDLIQGSKRKNKPEDKFPALSYIESVNGAQPIKMVRRRRFANLTPIYPEERLKLENPKGSISLRIVDLIAPIGKGQRGMIVAPPKVGKTTLLKDIANSISHQYKDIHLMILLIDERPEEVTDIRESITGDNVEVIYSTFDEQPEHHKRTAELAVERAKRLVEMGQDVVILLDSITRLARANNLTVAPSGRTLSGGLDPASLYFPKKFFGAARNIREGGSLTILATSLVDTGSKMDDVIFEEFKGTGNMELVLDRKLQEKRIFPAIDLAKSGTRCDDLLLSEKEEAAAAIIHKALSSSKKEEAAERLLELFVTTDTNDKIVEYVTKKRYI